MLSRLFNRIPDRYLRFRKTAATIAVLSWVPFAYGLYTGANAVLAKPETALLENKPLTKIAFKESVKTADTKTRKLSLSFALLVASYAIGSPATAYAVASFVRNAPKKSTV